MKRWNKLVEDRTLLSIILAGTIVLTMVTVGIVLKDGNNSDITIEESSSDSYVASGEVEQSLELTSEVQTEDLQQADVNESYVDISMEESTEIKESESQTTAVVLQFGETSLLTWPIIGNILRDYSMDHTVYHATLEQYKVSPAVLIQGEPGENVVSPAVGQITEVGYDEEIGNYVVLDIGSGYEVLIGQLDKISVVESQYVTAKTPLGVVAKPTIYHSVEGPNVYFQVKKDGVVVDPMDYLE